MNSASFFDAQACQHFRNKKMYVPSQEADALSAEPDPNGLSHCWCNRTQSEIGLDSDPVNLRDCAQAERRCYLAR